MFKYLSLFCNLSISLFLLTIGCSKPILKIPEPLPQIVKTYKHTKIYGNIPGMQNTGIYLNKGDIYSMFGTGKIDKWPSSPNRNASIVYPGMHTRVKIGDHLLFGMSPFAFIGDPLVAHESGKLYLGIEDGKYDDNVGSFNIDIIVWEREDWVQVVDFYEKLKKKDPSNKIVDNALVEARKRKEVYLAELKVTEEVEKIEKEMEELTEKPEVAKEGTIKSAPESKTLPLATTSDAALEKKERMAQLEEKLAQLTATLAQLEEMKRKWDEERKKTTLLTKELEKQRRREQELLSKLEQSSKTPPIIIIASPKDGIDVEIPLITFSGVAIDDQGLQRLEVFINNEAQEVKTGRGMRVTEKGYPTRLDFKEQIRLMKGENQIKISAVDSDGLITEKILAIYKIDRRRNIWAVIIGINNYRNIRKLKYAVNDAKAFYQHLVDFNKIPGENVMLLLNEDANLTKLRSMLGTHLKNKAGKEDMVIIYFAGHGATEKDMMSPDGDGLEKYLLPYDVDPKDLYATALPMGEISRIFKRIKSARLIFIVDSCYSGASGGRTISLAEIRAKISDSFLDRIAGGRGKIILTGSGANEVSEEKESLSHGVFTYFLLEGLRGSADTDQDGLITVDEAYRYVSKQVPKATNQEQHPVKKGTVEGQLILSIIERY